MAGAATPATAASSAVVELGRLVGDGLLAQLVAEARQQAPPGARDGGRQVVGGAGDVLARFAVSRQLAAAISRELGTDVVSTHRAVYQYQPPGSHVRPHRDAEGYDLVLHLTVEHAQPAGATGSVLVAGDDAPVAVPPGHAVVLRGRDVVHEWTPLAEDEHRTLVAAGFRTATKGDTMTEKDKDETTEADLEDLTPEGESADEVKGGRSTAYKYN